MTVSFNTHSLQEAPYHGKKLQTTHKGLVWETTKTDVWQALLRKKKAVPYIQEPAGTSARLCCSPKTIPQNINIKKKPFCDHEGSRQKLEHSVIMSECK